MLSWLILVIRIRHFNIIRICPTLNAPDWSRTTIERIPIGPSFYKPVRLKATLNWVGAIPMPTFMRWVLPITIAALEQISSNFSRLWMLRVYDTVTDPAGLIRAWLAEHTIPLEDQPFSGESNIRAQGFLLAGTSQLEGQPVLFEDGMSLVGWHLPDQIWLAGQTIPVKLWWATTVPPSTDYKMSLKMWTSTGELAAQGQDEWPVGTLYRATSWPIEQTVLPAYAVGTSPGCTNRANIGSTWNCTTPKPFNPSHGRIMAKFLSH